MSTLPQRYVQRSGRGSPSAMYSYQPCFRAKTSKRSTARCTRCATRTLLPRLQDKEQSNYAGCWRSGHQKAQAAGIELPLRDTCREIGISPPIPIRDYKHLAVMLRWGYAISAMSPRPIHEDDEQIILRRGTFLVLWEALTRTLRNREARREIAPDKYEITFQVDEAERRALHWLAGAIERAIPEVWTG